MNANCILIAPLNWGLGHATRCIPIISELLAMNKKVILASDGRAFQLLEKEFPQLKIYQLPAYQIRYKYPNMVLNMALQLPQIMRAISKEGHVIKTIVEEQHVDLIISDNRYGCRHSNVKNVFISHQLNIKTPYWLTNLFANKGNEWFLNKFDECWIPDEEGAENLSGDLSQKQLKIPARFLGPLSRIKKEPRTMIYDIMVILSGPEPQRTMLEEKIIEQVLALPYQVLIVKGKTELQKELQLNEQIKSINFLNSEALNEAMMASRWIISRSGYSTIMDLAMTGKKALLIPTPGQTEQEYLAKRFNDKKIFLTQTQDELNIAKAVSVINDYSGYLHQSKTNLKAVLKNCYL